MQNAAFVAAALVFAIGLHGMLTRRNMIRICISISVMESSLVMALVAVAYVPGGSAPIVSDGQTMFVDPLPHALALTAIVIGAGILAIALALTVAMYRHYGTTDVLAVFGKTREGQ